MRSTGTRVQTPPFSLLRWVLRGLTATEMNAGAGHVVCKRDDWSRGKGRNYLLLIQITQ